MFCALLAVQDWQHHAARWASTGNTGKLSSMPVAFVCHYLCAYYLERLTDPDDIGRFLGAAVGKAGEEQGNDAQVMQLDAHGFVGRR